MLQFYYYVILFDSDFEKSLAIMNACEVSLRLFQAYIPFQEHWDRKPVLRC